MEHPRIVSRDAIMMMNIIKIIENLSLLIYYKARIMYSELGDIDIPFPFPYNDATSSVDEVVKEYDEVIKNINMDSTNRDETYKYDGPYCETP